ncbi:hypothetical protein V6N11_006739 [Hibiscus sabdariffa]|uniref:Uncharacterized protein n=1 Tax=Hibiscus sabdariffa TaxID=183260 RepID=A0ABR2RRL1_9ROSI
MRCCFAHDTCNPDIFFQYDMYFSHTLTFLAASCTDLFLITYIQICKERQCPPADVAQIIDSANENLWIYCEIQRCTGRNKNRILALVHCKEEAPRSLPKSLITKLNVENPHLFRAMILWHKTPRQSFLVIPLIDGWCSGFGAESLSLELIDENMRALSAGISQSFYINVANINSRIW